jgi:hypothetical protein
MEGKHAQSQAQAGTAKQATPAQATPLKTAPCTVVMSGGAPQSPLMAGFLRSLWKARVTFTNFHTSGAGALMALLFLAPGKKFIDENGKPDPGAALENWVEAGVADEIYRALPQNFKLFHKPGPFAPIFQRLAERFKVPIEGAPPPSANDPVSEMMAELLAPLGTYSSKASTLLRKDPIEQTRDFVRAMWLGDPDPQFRNNLLATRDPIRRLREKWLMSWLPKEEDRRLYNDMVDLVFSAMTPSTLTSRSLGMAAPLPFLDELVDFGALPGNVAKLGGHICVNAYNMTLDAKLRADRRGAGGSTGTSRCKERRKERPNVMQLFYQPYKDPGPGVKNADGDYPLTAEGIRAAFSMPFIYPPAKIGDEYFSEGADHEPINLRHVLERNEYPFVLLDVLGELEDFLVRKPRDLWDSYVISIMTPVVALASEEIRDFQDANADWCDKMIVADWQIPVEAQPFVMDWSRSNMKTLFEVGQKAGDAFLASLPQPVKLARHPLA